MPYSHTPLSNIARPRTSIIGLPHRYRPPGRAATTVSPETPIRAGRRHNVRHTASTAFLMLGAPERIVMAIKGW
ncbi:MULTISPECIES: hypothetical protein [Kitasatospora]|uniref:hypothetical protein n=1 Tax=Kitasatospora TaxID=2063 RepID=UPI000C70E1FF|nr:hypothetical protein [Kitasatospora sp. GP30]MDH6138209.1 hypothetical protein [Kitasatospora sp. GP30]